MLRILKYSFKPEMKNISGESVEKVDTLLDGDAVRKNQRFLTALYPRQYHPSALEKPLNKRFFAYKVFFRRAGMGKTKNAAWTPQK